MRKNIIRFTSLTILAVIELTRHHGFVAEQTDLHGEIMIIPNEGFQEDLDISNIDDYSPRDEMFGSGDPGFMVE